jgi:radical SAM protein with 4Fe4S-binding SPASM domain
LGGITFCFISHVGDVQPCGYFDMQLGNVKEQDYSDIWTNSPVFKDLRDYSLLKGKCGACEYKGVCGGCRARALANTGDYLDEEPYCAYVPRKWAAK